MVCRKLGSSGFLASNLQSGLNKIEIEATTTKNPNIKTIGIANVNLPGQGKLKYLVTRKQMMYINNSIECPLLAIIHPVCNPSIVGNSFTFTFDANKPNVEYSCSLNNKQPRPCSKTLHCTHFMFTNL